MTAKEYLLDIGFDDAHLPELFNDDDKSYYQIAELMESYHQSKVKNLGIHSVVFSDQKERSRFQKDIDDCYAHEDEEENETFLRLCITF